MVHASMTQPVDSTATRSEWWERVRDRVNAWVSKHPVLVGRVRLVWLAVGLVGLVAYGVMALLLPNVRAAAGVYVGVAWLLVCWFAFARTRTLTLGGFVLLWSACVPWSVLVGLVSLRLADTMPANWVIDGAAADGPTIAIAAIAEESLKLLPVALLAVLAPGRVRRFATVDWLLVGFAAGAAFLTVEEVQRRLATLAPSRSILDFCKGGSVGERLDCYHMVQFGLNPFSSKLPFSGIGGSSGDLTYAGHHVMTALVAAGVGFGIALWRSAVAAGSSRGATVRAFAAVVLPLALFWVAVADHAVFNAAATGGSLFGSANSWAGAGSSVPLPFRIWYYIGGHGQGRTGLLVLALVAALLADAARARHRGYWSILLNAEPEAPVWAGRADRWWRSRLAQTETSGPVGWLPGAAASLGGAALSLVYVVGRDLRQSLGSHARQPDESRTDAMIRGRVVLMMQREAREVAADLDAGSATRGRLRLLAVALLVVLLGLALVVAPHVAASIGYDTNGGGTRWLAGLAETIGRWWGTLTPGQQLALMALAGLALAIPFGLGWGMFLAGGLSYLAAHGRGLGALIRNPRQATQSYLTQRSLGGMALDVGEFALTFIPAGVGSVGGTLGKNLVRESVEDYLLDPVAWNAARKAAWKQSAGARRDRGWVTIEFASGLWIVNGLRPRAHIMAGKVWKGQAVGTLKAWPEAVRKAYPDGVFYSRQGFPDFSPYAVKETRITQFHPTRRQPDYDAANANVGLKTTPEGYIWHHVEDKHTMQLVPRDLHEGVPHTGGHAVNKPKK